MGQGASQPAEAGGDGRRQRLRDVITRRSPSGNEGVAHDEWQPAERLLGDGRSSGGLQRSPSHGRRLSSMLSMGSGSYQGSSFRSGFGSTRSTLGRTRSRLGELFANTRDATQGRSDARPSAQPSFMQHRTSYVQPGMTSRDGEYYLPRLPSIDLSSTFEHDAFTAQNEPSEHVRPSSSLRRPNIRFNAFRPDRPIRSLTSSLRRRRQSPPRPASARQANSAEDQAAMLSRLLSVAAAATAATLMGDDHQALSEARSLTGSTGLGDLGGSGEDGSFDGFLRALQNGRIASALRQGASGEQVDGEMREAVPLNFFRMFRFGNSATTNATADSNSQARIEANRRSTASQDLHGEGNESNSRMVPIIIVGIRSISPNSSDRSAATDDLPPFIEALGNFPSPIPTQALGQGHDSIDSILQPPQNGTSFRHRRRANSMGGFGLPNRRRSGIDDRLDDQRSPDRRRERPWSVASTASTWDGGRHPPPVTPASPTPELSRINSRNTTPSHSRPASFVANSVRELTGDSRRNSVLNRASMASPLSSHTEETMSLHSAHSNTNLLEQSGDREEPWRNLHRRSDTMPNVHYPRFASGHPRRNGVVEPDHLPPLSRTSTAAATDASPEGGNQREGRSSTTDSRSWIIYVLGGSYPENHPILTTPSLFTENPTYEDMMLLSALLGPAKAPVATEDDVNNAGGIYNIEIVDSNQNTINADAEKTAQFVAVAVEGEDGSERERVLLDVGQRCLVCLCDFETKEIARKLVKCNHLFHKECIDQWLTQGRNSCPLCRGQGVDEKDKSETSTTATGEAGEAAADDHEQSANRTEAVALEA